MKNQENLTINKLENEEFEIINIEKDLSREKKSAIVSTTLKCISSAIFMSLGIFYARQNNIPSAVLEGIASAGFVLSAKLKIDEIHEINKKIKSLKK